MAVQSFTPPYPLSDPLPTPYLLPPPTPSSLQPPSSFPTAFAAVPSPFDSHGRERAFFLFLQTLRFSFSKPSGIPLSLFSTHSILSRFVAFLSRPEVLDRLD